MIIDIPFIKTKIKQSFIGPKNSFENCYIFSVTCLPSRPLLFNAHLECGAIVSRIPINAFKNNDYAIELTKEKLQPYSVIGHKSQSICHEYLKDYTVKTKECGTGRYLFTIDSFDGNFSEDPEQHKTFNIIELDNGQLAALPNNYCLFLDTHFTENKEWPKHIKRNTEYWRQQ